MAEQLSIFLDSAKEMMGNLFGRLDGVCTSLKESSESMKQLTGVIAEREEGSKKRHEERKRKDLGKLIIFQNLKLQITHDVKLKTVLVRFYHIYLINPINSFTNYHI
jgi:hypothetical protein